MAIRPQGVCFWLTIDLPGFFLAGGRPPGLTAVFETVPGLAEVLAGLPGRAAAFGAELDLAVAFGAEPDLGVTFGAVPALPGESFDVAPDFDGADLR
ncbi:MAG: hypothetical protein ABR604_01390 [Jatrophihabitantaceae bacterium]